MRQYKKITMRQYKTINKSSWPEGPWHEEPDKVQWKDDATGMPCLAVRNPHSGHWCGYVGVPPGHKFHGVPYHNIDIDIYVHGGLTFSDSCDHGPEESSICHIPEPGEPDNVWWLGFDCHHSFDYTPVSRYRAHGSSYRTLDYVKQQCAELAAQL